MQHTIHNIGRKDAPKWSIKANGETISYAITQQDAEAIAKDLDAMYYLNSRGYRVTQWLSSTNEYPTDRRQA